LKIFQIIPNLAVAGAEIMVENLIYELKERGCDVTAVSFYDYQSDITKRLEANGIRIIYLGKKKGFDLGLLFRLYKLLKAEKPDVVHTHIGAAQYTFPTAKLAKIKKIVHTVHSIAQKENLGLNKKINKLYFKYAGVVPVALSKSIQESIFQVYGITAENVPVVFNGMPVDKYITRDDYSIGNQINIVHIGRFSVEKNHKGLIEAFEKVSKVYPQAVLNLYGDGLLLNSVKIMVDEKNMGNKVVFHGITDRVPEVLSKSDIFCLSSIYEGVPMTLIEAMASAMPIVATAVGGVPDMLTNERDAFVCSNNVDDFAQCLIMLIKSKELRESFGQNALKRAHDFSSRKMAEEYMKLY